MKTYQFKLTDDLTIPVRANSREEAESIVRAEILKKEASPIFDKFYFDYETGINIPGLRATLGRQEKLVEKERVLRKYVDNNFTMTTKGDLAITPEGQRILKDKGLLDDDFVVSDKNIVIDENKAGTAGDYADFSGAIGPIAGAILSLNPAFRVLGLTQSFFKVPSVSRAITVGIGSAAGKGSEELLDYAQGFQAKDENELAELLGTEFVIGATAQGIGEVASKAFGAFFGRKASPETVRDFYIVSKGLDINDVAKLDADLGREATEREIMKAVKSGKIKPVGFNAVPSQQALGAALRSRFQAAGETVFGKTKREREIINYNFAILEKLRAKIADKRASLKEYSDVVDEDNVVISEVLARKKQLEKSEQDYQVFLKGFIKDLSEESGGFQNVSLATDPTKRELGENINQILTRAYKDMITDQENGYKNIFNRIEKLDPNFESIITPKLKPISDAVDEYLNQAKGLIEEIGDPKSINLIKKLRDQINDGQFTFTDLIQVRKLIKTQKNIAKAAKKPEVSILAGIEKILNDAVDELPKEIKSLTGLSENLRNKMLKVANDLENQNASYYKSHLPFDNAMVQAVKNSKNKSGSDIYDAIFNSTKDVETNFEALVNAIPANQKNALVNQMLRRYIKEVGTFSTKDGIIDAGVFANKVIKDKAKLVALMGPKLGNNFFDTVEMISKLKPNLTPRDFKELAENIGSRVGQLEATGLPGANALKRFIDELEVKAQNSAQILDAKKSRLFNNIEKTSPEEVSKIVFRPKSSEDILRVKRLVSEDAFTRIQEQSLEQLIKDSVQTGSTKLNEIFKPGNLERALATYGDDTLQAMFGKELTQALKNYSRTLRLTAGTDVATGAGSLVAGTLALNVFNVSLLPIVAMMGVYKQVFSNPRIVSLLAKQDKNSIAEVLRFFERAVRLAGVREVGLQIDETSKNLQESFDAALESETAQDFQDVIESTSREFKENIDLELPVLEQVSQAQPVNRGPSLLPNPQDVELANRLA
jgi:hypothetical protein